MNHPSQHRATRQYQPTRSMLWPEEKLPMDLLGLNRQKGDEMARSSGLGAVIFWSIAVSLMATVASCSGEQRLLGMKSCEKGKDVKLRIRLDGAGDPSVVEYDYWPWFDVEFAVVCPNKRLIWRLPGSKGFAIRFKDQSPFAWTYKESTGGPIDEVVPELAPYGGYPYTVEVAGSTIPLDPIIIVDR